MSLVVFGSLNMDLVVRAPRLPVPGETLTGDSFFTAPGGKGANQAVACARLGAPTRLIGRVGGDVFGETLLKSLAGNRVDVSGVSTDPVQPTGVALITVDARAENTIVIIAGANGQLDSDDVTRLTESPTADDRVLLLQLEAPLETVTAAARAAHQRGLTVILDPAPARPLSPELYRLVDFLTPNENEAEALTGLSLNTDAAIGQAAGILLKRGVKNVIIKLGGRGAYAHHADQSTGTFLPAFHVNAIDTVAAGDAFNGGLAVALAEGKSFGEALRWGLATGAISTTRPGAQPSMPTRTEVEQLLSTHT